MKKFLNEKEAAEFLNLSPATLMTWRSRNIGPEYYKFGGMVRYSTDDLIEYANKNKVRGGKKCYHQ